MYVSGYCVVPKRFAVASFGSWYSGSVAGLGLFWMKSSRSFQASSGSTRRASPTSSR